MRKIVVITVLFCACACTSILAQEEKEKENWQFKFEHDSLALNVGDTMQVSVQLVDESGELVRDNPFFLFSRGTKASRSIEVTPRSGDSSGAMIAKVIAHRPGSFKLAARTATYRREDRVQGSISVEVVFPPLAKIEFVDAISRVYLNTTVSYRAKVFDAANLERREVEVHLKTSEPELAAIDPFGNLTAHRTGKVLLIAEVEEIRETLEIELVTNPVVSLELEPSQTEARTGDVIQFDATARNTLGLTVEDAPIHFSFQARPDDGLGPPASGQIDESGRFVAETPGLYTIAARSGPFIKQITVRIRQREVQQKVELVGHGPVLDVLTSDLWVWEGVDGRDYAITGTWGANGDAFFWDVTDPANMQTIDTIRVDARTVNDVKVSEDGRVAVISREGASNRRNGIVILDVTNPREVKVLSRFDEGLTGGVHNVFIDDHHVYAINNGRRFDVINIEDPTKPYRVGDFELSTPGHGIHDVWIENGIAYSSNWQDGVHLIDIGGATQSKLFEKYRSDAGPEFSSLLAKSGAPANPAPFGSYEYPSGWNHAAFPYYSESTGKFYVLAGDEAFPYGDGAAERRPTIAAGWIHFVEFTDPKTPKEVARYAVPEAGSHNFWVEGDTLYAAFYNGGLRVVDISGDLMGDLYRQGREITWYLPGHPDALIPNASMVWGPQPHKGLIFLSDHHSGLWAVKLVPKDKK